MIVFYEKYSDVINAGISAMAIDADGEFAWPQQMAELCSVLSEKVHPVAGNFMMGQWVTAWEDDRNGNRDIYAQNIQLDGSLGPVTAGEVMIHPDTLFFEENPQTLQVAVVNNTLESYTLIDVDESGEWWHVTPYPAFPYEIAAGDSLVMDVYFEYNGSKQVNGYTYDTLNMIATPDTHRVVIAINEMLLSGLVAQKKDILHVYPNPSSALVNFKFDRMTGVGDRLVLLSQTGQVIREWSVYQKERITWDGRDQYNESLPSGVYIYQLRSGTVYQTGKITLVR
jgi:hypothetical protein